MSKLHHSFPLEKVFEFKAIKQAKSQKDIPTDDNGVPYVVQSTVNNMVARFVNKQYLIDNDEAPVSGNAIVLGVTLPAVSYQKNEFGASQVITARSEHLDEKVGMYLVGVLSKYMEQFSYQRKPGMAIYKAMEVSFPVIENSNPNHEYTVDDIDWQYMHDRITELEHDRITELDAYLQAADLNDYELTEDDKKILSLSSEDEVRFGEFDITKIFTVKNTKCIIQNQIVPNSGDIPYVTAGDGNNAISTYIDCPIEWIDNGNCVFIGGKTLVITYQEKDFCSNDSHNLALYLNNEEYQNGYVYRYMVGALKSALSHKYYWGDSISRKKIQNDKMLLPTKSDGTPDFDYMERYIRAMEKAVIADVVKYKDKAIETTKKVVGD